MRIKPHVLPRKLPHTAALPGVGKEGNASNTSTSEEEEEEEEDEESGENGEREEKEEKEEEDKLSPFYSCDSDSSSEEKEGTSALRTDPGDTEESSAAASEPKAVVGVSQVGMADSVSKPVATVRTQSLPRELVTTPSVTELSPSPSRGTKCVVS